MGSEITPQMREWADKVAANAEKKTQSTLAKQGESVGLGADIRAKWKIEVMFGPKRTLAGPNHFGLSVWQSGKRLNGGGDDLSFWCIKADESGDESREGCGGIIVSDNVKGGVAFCPNCKRAVNAEMLTQLRVGFMSSQNLSIELEKLFRKLDSSADIYLKFDRMDVRTLAMAKAKGTEVANKLRGLHIYPLKNIIKDTVAGASLQGRFKAFLTS